MAILGGLVLRLQYTGFLSLEGIDLRRSHSHLGFYGFLFPLMWHELKNQFWVPGKIIKRIYILLLILSTIGFATAGYGVIAHISSFLTLVIWLIFAFKNIKTLKNLSEDMTSIIPLSIIASASVVLLVLISRFGTSVAPLLLVRVFLVILLFGVFAPMALRQVSNRIPHGVLWLVSVVGFGLLLAENLEGYLLLMPALLGGLICYSIFPSMKATVDEKNRIRLYWIGIALVLFLITLKVVPNNHFTAVSGIHFFVFLIIVPTFLKFKNNILKLVYEGSALAMVGLIYSQNITTWNYHSNQIALSLVSISMVFLILFGLKAEKKYFIAESQNNSLSRT